jgi:D-3-phosphoglycerate dehydrogenase / 2-oxoglutarate reductase
MMLPMPRMPDRPRILIAEPLDFSPQAVAILGAAGEVVQEPWPAERLPQAFQEFDAVWLRLAHRVDAAILGPRPRCRVLAAAVTGLDHLDLDACRERGVRVVSLRGETDFLKTVRATAEHTVALLLALLRRIPEAANAVRRGEWRRDLYRGHELHGKTAGIVGVGRLGTLVAGYLRAFGMRVVGHDPHTPFAPTVAEPMASLEALLAVADVVSLHVPYSTETRGLLGARQFAALKPGAVLVNTARGGVIDEAALLAALESGHLAGAALDVLDGEPEVSPDHPLIQAARRRSDLLIVPHLGGNTWESLQKTEVFLAHKVVAALVGEAGNKA